VIFEEAMDEFLLDDELRPSRLAACHPRAHPRINDDWLAAEWAEPSEVFDAVTNALGRRIPAPKAGSWRFEASGDEASRCPALMDCLLQGRILDHWNLWEAANHLRLPSHGPFVVIAADVPCIGTEAVPEVESRLRCLDVYSAWRVLPDLHVGITHVESDQQLAKILALVSRTRAPRRRECPLR
jgi:hypothetical protein